MYFAYEGAPLHLAPKRALPANVQERIRRIEGRGGEADPTLAAERDALRRQVDLETLACYEALHSRYMGHRMGHRRGAEAPAEQMKEAAPEYCAAMWRERRRYDAETPAMVLDAPDRRHEPA
jgi:hypothetical protein